MNFGVPEHVLTQFLKTELVRVRSLENENNSYLFRQSKKLHEVNGIFKTVWTCVSCEKLRKQDIILQVASFCCRLHIQHAGNNETMISNPLIGHHNNCNGVNNAEVEAKQLQREMNKECSRGVKRPKKAYNKFSAEITERYDDDDLQDAVENQFPDYKKARRSLFRHAEKGIIAVDNPREIP